MNTYWKRTLAITSISAAAVFGLTACGGDSTAPTSSSSSEQAEAPASGDQLTVENFAERISKAQLEAGTVHSEMSMTLGEQAQTMSSDLQLAEDPSQMKMNMTMTAPSAMEIRLVDSVMYMNMGEMTQNKFIATDLNSPEAAQYASMLSQSNPQEQMELFASAVQDFQVSDETVEIDGVDTYEYTLTLDTATLLEGQNVPTEGVEMPETVNYVMNIGADDLPRLMISDMGGTQTEMTYTKWGEEVSIEAPSADELIEM
ncbi:MAG: hypothetical protein ACTIJ6_07685 [Leucobacter sp.]